MARHTALYCRISKDKNGRAEGVDAQERQGRDYAASAWPDAPVTVYCDNDLTAADDDVHRPQYEALRQAIRDGDVAHVWAVEQSRLERREVEWFRLAAELDAAGIADLHTNRDGIVRVRDEIAGIKAVINAGEIRKLKARINARLADNAAQGTPPGSLPFGYAHGVNDKGEKTYVIVPDQAEAIRWAADKVLAGWSLSSVAAGLRQQGLAGPHRVKIRDAAGDVVKDAQDKPVTRATALTAGSVRSMLTKPTIAGYRVHGGRTVGRGNWPPILDDDTWQACRSKLSAPRTVRRSDGGTYPLSGNHSGYSGRKYTLTGGLAVCGVCEAPMVGSLKQLGPRKRVVAYLLCHKKNKRPDGTPAGSCTGIMLEATEKNVAERLFAELDRPAFLELVGADDHAARRDQITTALGDIDRQREELAAMWAVPGELTSAEWRTARRALAETEQDLRAELAAVPPPLTRVSIENARESYPGMTLGEKREFLRLFIERVTISRAVPGTHGFDPGRIGIDWRKR